MGNGTARGNEPETIYAVVSGEHVNDKCCFDYGNAEGNDLDTGAGSMGRYTSATPRRGGEGLAKGHG